MAFFTSHEEKKKKKRAMGKPTNHPFPIFAL
jgi:hypothetical protein